MKRFLTRLEKKTPRGLDSMIREIDQSIWIKTNCQHCANCCKTMSPTYSRSDIIRIAKYLGMTAGEFRKKWLFRDKSGDWLNVQQPCQFLDLNTNMCGIYEVRPRDCAGFPHHNRKKMVDYLPTYKQNIEFCPATYRVVEKLIEKVNAVDDNNN